jgi:hypothetical protein
MPSALRTLSSGCKTVAGRRTIAAIGRPAAPVFKGLRMRLGDVDQPLISPTLIYCDNDIGAAKRIGLAENAD